MTALSHQSLLEKLKDERSRRVIFVAHCVLNQNTRYLGGAFRQGSVDELVDELQKSGAGIVQMSCPEQQAWGGVLKKWMWLPLGRKNSVFYRLRGPLLAAFLWNTRRIFRKLAEQTADEVRDYIDSGFEVMGVLGIGGSPCCGIKTTVEIKRSVELLAACAPKDLDRERMNRMVRESLVPGRGLYIAALQQALARKGLSVPFFEHDLIAEMDGKPIHPDLPTGNKA